MAQKPKTGKRRPSEDERVDEGIAESFPASDPPSMTSPMAATPSDATIADGPGGAPGPFDIVEAGSPELPGRRVPCGGLPCTPVTSYSRCRNRV